MIKVAVQVVKYALLVLMLLFTAETFLVLKRREERARRRIMRNQIALMILFDTAAFAVLFLQSRDQRMLYLYGALILYIILVQVLYRLIYKKASLILLNCMCMMLSIGFVIQARLGIDNAIKQFVIAAGSTLLCFIIPVLIRKAKFLSRITWVYAVVGLLLLGVVFILGRRTGGANLNLEIFGISFQFSEFVKITFVLFLAGLLVKSTSFKQVLVATLFAAIHVGVLVLSRDLGAAIIFFIAYIVMVYAATRNPGYAALGLGGIAGASVVAYKLFDHIRIRVQVWRNPFADYEVTGYQIVQALFGIVAGGWFGTGLFEGNPEMIPVVHKDFTFAAICEEMGILFGILLILLCMGMYMLIINIAMKLNNRFYKYVAIGLGTEYAFQVFLTIGGATKFIPMTGITLPLISYGGSSLMCTIIMLSIIQGLYIMREDEEEEKAQRLGGRRIRRRQSRPAIEEERRRQSRPAIGEERRRQSRPAGEEERRRQRRPAGADDRRQRRPVGEEERRRQSRPSSETERRPGTGSGNSNERVSEEDAFTKELEKRTEESLNY